VTEGNCNPATVNKEFSHEVIGIDQDMHSDVTRCNETVGVLDGNSNLHRNCIDSDMNIISSSIQECDCR
jgi:hypothetical protein